MALTANVLYVSNKLDYVFNLEKCFVVKLLQCYNGDSLALVLTSDTIKCPSHLVYTKDTLTKSHLEVLESATFSEQTFNLLYWKMHNIVKSYNDKFAD
ncbi:ac117 [Choristoneura murinana nucleopolyhedrovirus]|uniref:Ac117 n=1 Tax=Choristoneura murinana nucleopolyhedrovirus TaxID=1987479 RepID=V9XVA8_9ABAC|nr:ac117 [Choristoneura murinana nucleopolyhedrovirus]AHD25528.1 ac117 [Choristoneura murinana nucleopolyhedrovirus]